MKLIVVTTPTFFVEEDKIITALFEEGLDILHLRKPETPAMYSERLLTLIPEKYHKRIVMRFFGISCIQMNSHQVEFFFQIEVFVRDNPFVVLRRITYWK